MAEIRIESATPADFDALRRLLEAEKLPTEDLDTSRLAGFLIAWRGSGIVGAVGVEPYGDIGLLRSLVVANDARYSGLGGQLVTLAERLASGLGIRVLYLLTTTAGAYFERFGYGPASRASAPTAISKTPQFSGLWPFIFHLHEQIAVSHRPYNVLFLCTGNSARSILAEAALNHLPISSGRFVGYSAGSHPKGEPNPYALELLERSGIPTKGLRSKSWDEFAQLGSPALDFIFTVCDQAAGEACPYWPGKPMTAHWGMPDPAAVIGTPDEIRQAFTDTFVTLKRRIEIFASLPFDKLDHLAMLQQVKEAGRS